MLRFMARQVTQCPVCEAPLHVTELSCAHCDTKLHGVFPPPPLARLASEHQQFVETFLLCRGVIRDVERALDISYPTVRARLDAAIAALKEARAEPTSASSPSSLAPPRPGASPDPAIAQRRRELLRQVEEGRLGPAEAAEALRGLS